MDRQTFLQLVLLSIIIVGQNVQSAAADRGAGHLRGHHAVLHTALEIQQHMEAQDREISQILEEVQALRS